MNNVQIKLAIYCYEKGMSSRQISEMEDMPSRTTILKELRRNGAEIRKEGIPLGGYSMGKIKWSEKEIERWGFKTREELEQHFKYWRIRGRSRS